mmetsp:Transcript_5740/g.6676  ORF Transcript_5740/g.6676 Transcript_5740/m.6676 type:complete len:100 (-) Transcript_5740:239-538(-)|eukprot:CAMPEP_0198249986 /NCGR_PEP_ID=MMETSP1447-20131203/1334_1 /TAXON_ID=420782 /ORGANISM="Chaetoceros dichaeta, Strain CCMP1751" /LENGTH=99 /DNA_ID=CAMNT_0043934745 /DNA_START=98 /DNA_END=397 /DNA_ORIENTATION=-
MSIIKHLALIILVLSSSLVPDTIGVDGKEIIATREWQLLQEGDTVPAGLHIRMDLERGQKWARLDIDDDDMVVPPLDKRSSTTSSVIVNTSGDHSVIES